jgi:hypothetical protein
MKIGAVLLSFLLFQESTAKLTETIRWLCNYTNTHGYLYENGSLMQTTRLHSVQDCTLQLERHFSQSKAGNSIKQETVSLELADLDPNVHVQITRSGSPSFQVTFERSDGADRIKTDLETNDGTKAQSHESNEWIYLDSEESMNRVAKGLSHAITLCGGKPAPF